MTTTEVGVMVPLWAMKDCAGDPRDGMLWAQITWWFQPDQRYLTPRTKHLVERFGETWMYCTDADLAKETGMSVDQVYRARRALIKRALIDSRSATVNGQKMTLVRPIVEPRRGVDDEDEDVGQETIDHSAIPRDLAAESRKQGSAESRKLLLLNRDGSTGKPARGAGPDSVQRFETHFWPIYPDRDGKKLDKRKALDQWNRLSVEDQRAAVRGARHYATSGQLPKDAHRWLRDRCFDDWQDPAKPRIHGNSHNDRGAGEEAVLANIARRRQQQ